MNNANVPNTQRVIWGDLVGGKPELEAGLSDNAKAMKADMYLQTFRNATDLDHVCRVPGRNDRHLTEKFLYYRVCP